MDKKNTMLLTVIAVATLLVAVVGATFAYFSVQAGDTGVTTAVNGSVATASIVTGTKYEENLYLHLSAADMTLANAGNYYATNVNNTATSNHGGKDIPVTHRVFGAVLTDAEAGVKYTCKFNLTATSSLSASAAEGEAFFVLSGTNTALDKTYDLKTPVSIDQEITWEFTSTNTEELIQAQAYIVNSTDDQSTTLSGATMSVEMNVTNFNCTVANS